MMKVFLKKALLLLATLILPVQVTLADNVQTQQDALLDRIQIEDLMINYYWDMNSEGRHSLSDYYTDDAVLDVNGKLFSGHREIQSAYDGGTAEMSGKVNMLMNNPKIRVNGDSATAETVWTGVIAETVRLAPRMFEQGREYSEMKKVGGRWLFSLRVITSDAGLPASYDDSYRQR